MRTDCKANNYLIIIKVLKGKSIDLNNPAIKVLYEFLTSMGEQPTEIMFNGKNYSIEMTWKYLEYLQTKMEQFACVREFKGRDLATLESVLKRIETTSSVQRSQIFAQVSNATARNQNTNKVTSQQTRQGQPPNRPSHITSSPNDVSFKQTII